MNQSAPSDLRLPLPARSGGRFAAVLRYACVLILGAVIGASGTVLLGRGILRYWASTPQEWPERASRRAATVLSLDEGERDAMRVVFAERLQAIQSIRREFYPRIHAEFDRLEADGAARLPAAKAARWKLFMQRMRSNYFLVDPPPDAGAKGSQKE